MRIVRDDLSFFISNKFSGNCLFTFLFPNPLVILLDVTGSFADSVTDDVKATTLLLFSYEEI